MKILLENNWSASPAPNGTWQLKLTNFGEDEIQDFTLCITSITRVLKTSKLSHAKLVQRAANFHEFAPTDVRKLAQGESWTFEIEGASRIPLHHNDAAKTAWLSLKGGSYFPVEVAPLISIEEGNTPKPQRLPEGKLAEKISLVPWPQEVVVKTDKTPNFLYPASSISLEDVKAILKVNQLHTKLFPTSKVVFSLTEAPESRGLTFLIDANFDIEEYRLEFSDKITIISKSQAGRIRALTSLAQMMHGANTHDGFEFPKSGHIHDKPRYNWRASHLDCCRQFWTKEQVLRFVDILAWYKFNIFHWHLTDDEAWRAEIKAFPDLTSLGATRTMKNRDMLPQLGDGPLGEAQYYSQDDMREVVAYASNLETEVMPEIETPGHANAVLAALPQLVDPEEKALSYYPLQGFPNNAWNPGVETTFEVLETVIDEITAIFPSQYLHIGGDEVAQNAWMESPKARALMKREGLKDTFELQSWFGKKMKAILEKRDKTLVGWNELSLGGGVERDKTILMAWESGEVGIELATEGYDVVMTPGEAYYLDMAQSDAWFENGAGWAGSVPPRQSYEYEADADFPENLRHKLRGVQSCIWCEHCHSVEWFNDIVFPRLLAVSEAGWTFKENKDFERFAAQAKIHPLL